MRTTVISGLIIGSLSLTLTACGTTVTSGTVVEKKIEQVADYDEKCKQVKKPVTETVMKNGKPTTVTKTKTVKECKQVFDEMEDVFRLKLEQDGKTGWVSVEADIYNSIKEGQPYGTS